MSRTVVLAVVLILLSIFSSFPFLGGIIPLAHSASASFSFAASGDMGSLTASTGVNNLNRLQGVNPGFFLGLGDFSYDPSVTGDIGVPSSSPNSTESRFSPETMIPEDTTPPALVKRTITRNTSTGV